MTKRLLSPWWLVAIVVIVPAFVEALLDHRAANIVYLVLLASLVVYALTYAVLRRRHGGKGILFHLWHHWRLAHDTGAHHYEECARCGARRVLRVNPLGHQPVHREWLCGGEWDDMPLRPPSRRL